jgi:hypothetical protein
MAKRSIPIFLLIGTFLLSAWGNVIAAAHCPRYLSNSDCYIKREPRQPQQVDHKPSCHHEMADMEMGDMQMDETKVASGADLETSDNSSPENRRLQVGTEFFADPLAVNLPTAPCGHCWMHSQPASGIATVVAVDPSKRLIETNAPPLSVVIALPAALPVSVAQMEHGPPGNVLPRHVLINVFRI